MMKSLLKELLYIHSLFSFMLYLAGNFIVIVTLEYKLKNPHLKHTLAGFVSIAISGLAAYIIPMNIFTNLNPLTMQLIGIFAAFLTQILFWGLWFRKRFKELMPALFIAFGLTAIVAVAMYFAFMAYLHMVIQEAIDSTGTIARYFITNF